MLSMKASNGPPSTPTLWMPNRLNVAPVDLNPAGRLLVNGGAAVVDLHRDLAVAAVGGRVVLQLVLQVGISGEGGMRPCAGIEAVPVTARM